MGALKLCRNWQSAALRFLLSFQLLVLTQALTLDNAGPEFIVGFLPNFDTSIIELHLTGDFDTTVDIEYPIGTNIGTATVSPGNTTIVSVPSDAGEAWRDGVLLSNLVRASSTDGQEFIMYMVNRLSATSDAALALPVDALNTEYIVADYNPAFESQILVYAVFDDTTVTITPNDRRTGVTIELNRGQGYLQTSRNTQTGYSVSSNRPVGVVNGNFCAEIPERVPNCDHIFEVAQPVQTWGKSICDCETIR